MKHTCRFILCLLLLLFPVTVTAGSYNIFLSHYKITDTLNVRSGPGTDYEVLMTAEPSVITIYQEQDGWGKVYLNGCSGWIFLQSSVKVEEEETNVFYQPGWSQSRGCWRYADADGQLIFSSNGLHDAWLKLSDASVNGDYCIAVDCTRNELYIFSVGEGVLIPVKAWKCSTGKMLTPTPKGSFQVSSKGYSFGEPKYSCYYYTEFTPGYLFHSILYDAGTFDVQDGRLGENVSNGCIRLALENAMWLQGNVPEGSYVLIY